MIKILVAGDFVPSCRIKEQIESGNYSCGEEIKEVVKQTDYAIVNLEAPVASDNAKPLVKTGPNLSCTTAAVTFIKDLCFNCVTLANNHFYDYSQEGVENTLKACKKSGIDVVGGGIDIDESNAILYKKIGNVTIAIINACEHEWSIASKSHGGSNALDIIQQYYAIKEAKLNSDYVIVIIHGGIEHYNLPTIRMKDTYRFFVDAGCDVVINHHQHCYSGYEIYKGKPIFYGLGNFCFDKGEQKSNNWNEGYLVLLLLGNNTINFELKPYIQCAENPRIKLLDSDSGFRYKIEELNNIISNEILLEKEFHNKAMQRKNAIDGFMMPYKTKFMRSLCMLGLLPSFIKKERLKKLLAHTQCESHRELMIEYLKSAIK